MIAVAPGEEQVTLVVEYQHVKASISKIKVRSIMCQYSSNIYLALRIPSSLGPE